MKLVLTSDIPQTKYDLTKMIIKIGSAPAADICLKDHGVAPFHAVISLKGGNVVIGPWDKERIVYVNGRQTQGAHPLKSMDEIVMGEAHFIFEDDVTTEDETAQTETSANGKPQPAVVQEITERQQSASELQQLAGIDPETLERLRRQSPVLRPATGLSSFLKQGLASANSQQERGIFSLIMAVPAAFLSAYQTVHSKLTGTSSEEAFPNGTWQFYTQFGLREDPARHANETVGFHQSIPANASEVDQAAAWAFQCITTMFEYESLLENEWVERTLLRLVHEAIADSVVKQIVFERLGLGIQDSPDPVEFEMVRKVIADNEVERIEIETQQVKKNFDLINLEWAWVKRRPYRKPLNHTETYPQYRRKSFLAFLVEVSDRLPSQMGAVIWDRYHELSSTALPAYQAQMSILHTLKPEAHQDTKVPIPIWRAKLGFVAGGRFYLINIAHHDDQNRLLVFKPGKKDDPGEPLILRENELGQLVDQHNRLIIVDRKGNVTITEGEDNSHIKVIRPTPPELIKAQIFTILREASVSNKSDVHTDELLAVAPRGKQPYFVQLLPRATQNELKLLADAPVVLNWDKRNRTDTLQKIRNSKRGIGNQALTVFRTDSSFVFDQSHIFYDAIWGMVISQVITDGAIEMYNLMSEIVTNKMQVNPLSPLRLQSNIPFNAAIAPYAEPFEITAETETPDLKQVNECRRILKRYKVPITVNDVLTFYRGLHDQLYVPGITLQRALAKFRLSGHNDVGDEIERMWRQRRMEPVSLLLPMDASFIDPKLRLFPATFKNFLPNFVEIYESTLTLLDQHLYKPTPEISKSFGEKRGGLMANLLVMTEYFQMLKRITRQGESISTAAIKYLAHLPPGMQDKLDLIPQHVGALNEILKGEEVFSNVGRVSPASSLVRFMSAKDDGNSKLMVWGIMCDKTGNLKIIVRDFRPYVAKLLKLGEYELASLIIKDYLEAYAVGLNRFCDDLGKIFTVEV